MIFYYRILKNIFIDIFSIDNQIIENCKIENKLKNHIKIRICIFILLIPILYILMFSYILYNFNLYNMFKTILLILFFRILAKNMTDYIIVIFFYKSSYRFTLKNRRKNKLNKLNSI